VTNTHLRPAPHPDSAHKALGRRLRAERESRSWTYRYLAGKLSDASAGICPVPDVESLIPQIRRWERGATGISQRYRTLYCIALGIGTELWDVSRS
jgi:transcriptional regulator with XRE-family HTH domain